MLSTDRFAFYSSLKSNLSMSSYLDELKHVKARNLVARLRLGVSPLKVHKLRFAVGATETDMLCPACLNDTESEVHFVLVCPCYDEIRNYYIAEKYYRHPSLFKLTMLFASEKKIVMLKLASYLLKAFQHRESFI